MWGPWIRNKYETAETLIPLVILLSVGLRPWGITIGPRFGLLPSGRKLQTTSPQTPNPETEPPKPQTPRNPSKSNTAIPTPCASHKAPKRLPRSCTFHIFTFIPKPKNPKRSREPPKRAKNHQSPTLGSPEKLNFRKPPKDFCRDGHLKSGARKYDGQSSQDYDGSP